MPLSSRRQLLFARRHYARLTAQLILLYPGNPTQIYAFAVDAAAAGVKYRPQQVLVPLLAPWEMPGGWRW